MGREHHAEAEEALKKAWSLRSSTTIAVQSCMANYFACLFKEKGDFEEAYKWLYQEKSLLKSSQLETRERIRYVARNFYYLAELNYLEGKMDLAQDYFQASIQWGKKENWQRFINYAQNGLASVLIEKSQLTKAENLLISGLSVALNMKELRRISHYHASFAKLYYKRFEKAHQQQTGRLIALEDLDEAKKYAEIALEAFMKEGMLKEQQEMEELLLLIIKHDPGILHYDI
jgi:tetratricopeptide (TPR) repeat protein